jgi:diadenylate cyclase
MNGKLARYGVRLPISQSTNLPSIYGTRHHAALGLSEVSDALVFVVSEERGTVNLFYQGKVHQIDTKEEAFSAITLHWRRTTSYLFDLSMNIKKWNFVPRVMASIGVAAFFWSTLHIAGFEMLEKVLTVPVEYVATPRDTVLVGDKAAEVKLHLVGRKPELDTLTPSQLSVKIDLSKAVPGRHAFLISQENVKLPKKVQLLDVVPSNLTLTLAGVMEQNISVKPQLVGKLPHGIKLKSVQVNPEKVRASFPSTAGKESTVSVMTTPIYLDSIEETTKIFCKIIAPPSFQPVEKRWPDVEVTIEVSSK